MPTPKKEAPMNEFCVGSNGEEITILAYHQGMTLSKEEALGLAAWLVACADPGQLEFQEILNAVLDT